MATAWIQVFILTFVECVAPAGKTVCQEQQFELQFLTQADCQYALEQLIAMKGEAEHVIVNRQKSVLRSAKTITSDFSSSCPVMRQPTSCLAGLVTLSSKIRPATALKYGRVTSCDGWHLI